VTLNAAVDAELQALPANMRARFIHISRLVEEFGLERVRAAARQTSARPAVGSAHKG
jgi:hypothetical protein